MRVELGLATRPTGGPDDTWAPADGAPADFAVRAGIDLDAAGAVENQPPGGGTPGGIRVPCCGSRLRAAPPRASSRAPRSSWRAPRPARPPRPRTPSSPARASCAACCTCEIPPLQIRGRRLLHIAIDGSLYEAVAADGSILQMPRTGDDLRLERSALLATGPGPAWPPLPAEAEPRMLARVPAAPGRGPAVLHGALPLRLAGGAFAQLPATARCALAFAVQVEQPGGPAFRPFQRLSWTGRDPRTGTWTALGADGLPAADVAAEYAAVAGLREADPDRVALAARFECADSGATLCPGEVAWSADDGRTVLVHLPQLDVAPLPAGAEWPAEPVFGFASAAVRVAEDGSTWDSDSTAGRRVALGAVAPIAEAAGLRRRRVRWRRLCAWEAEDWSATPPETLALTGRGRLDVDVAHGLFAFAAEEPPQAWPPDADGAAPPTVTTGYEEGATMHVGALPAAREPVLDLRLPAPTRLVCAQRRAASRRARRPPRHAALSLAHRGAGGGLEAGRGGAVRGQRDVPGGDAGVARDDLADHPGRGARAPHVLVDGWTLPAQAPRYAALTLRGLAVGGEDWEGMTLPPADRVSIELCTVLHAGNRLTFADLADGTDVSVTFCQTAGLELAGAGALRIADSIVDARPGRRPARADRRDRARSRVGRRRGARRACSRRPRRSSRGG